ncbi:Chromate transporter, chromate ion transporter (CHR) family [uncultured Alphaproteobacteria bacterium]|uniref:Chromate transporter, chromate ion transporter (CHR) family n=1 Tax=uncultured Alphaproteobacteria bacterium TaxID=91750 RepID=A0A212JB00_9PROT|nr:Chromate transporter, chromate ion transporter (CHR) family [uncultured Alphaproteobacteria bacterium]
MWRIFLAFLGLGLTAFGGPVAHIGYFEAAFVRRRAWLGAREFADLVALCHVLPGPASSQLGLAIGYLRGGVAGALAAWLGFTLPSALLLGGLGAGVALLPPEGIAAAARGLAWAAAAVVGVALLHMGKSRFRRPLDLAPALAAAVVAAAAPGLGGQLGALGVGALWGAIRAGDAPETEPGEAPGRAAGLWLAAWAALLALLPVAAALAHAPLVDLADRFYRAGSLVFGGGHVVLPLLKAEWVDAGLLPAETFLAGYGVAQAVPGPLFAISAFLGAALRPAEPVAAAAVATVAIFLPSMLLVFGILPYARALRRSRLAARILGGVNLAVIGLLAAAWVDPVLSSAIRGPWDAVAVAAGFALLATGRLPVVALVAALTLFGAALSL